MSNTSDYRYDSNGRLIEVKKNNNIVEAYNYDANANRILELNTFRGTSNRPFTYSNEDHVITVLGDVVS